MKVMIAERAWKTLAAELDRVAPKEGIALPLVAVRSAARPSQPRALSSIDALIVPDVLVVPAELQDASAVHVNVLPATDAHMQAQVARKTAAHPRLRVAAYLHSHPFANDRTWPSGGDYYGHMLPLLRQNADAGLDTSFSLIAARANRSWVLQCFALGPDRRIVDCGFAQLVPDTHEAIVWSLAPPLSSSARAMLRRICRDEQRRGRTVSCRELFDGFRRYVVRDRGAVREVIFVPCDFPKAPMQRYEVMS